MVFIVEAVVSALLAATFQALSERVVPRGNVSELVLRKISHFRRINETNEILLRNLEFALARADKVLSNAVERQLSSQNNGQWIEFLVDAVNQTVDLLDEIYSQDLAKSQSSREAARRKIIQKLKGKLEQMTNRLEEIAAKLDGILKESCSGKESSRLETSWVNKSEVYGRREDKEKIWSFLEEEPGQRNVMDIPLIAIIGMAGIGKTTLAKLLFNDSRVESRFTTRAWVHVSEDMDVLKVTKTLYEEVTGQKSDINNLNQLQLELIKRLRDEQFLFVFDDVWNEHHDEWNELEKVLNNGAHGSRIIVTTRSQDVASTMRASQTHHLLPLNDQDCWMVFAKQAFESPHTDAPPKLKPIAEDIKKKCGGLPLVARELGDLLHFKASKVDAEEWENILNEDLFDLSNGKNNILAWFRLSFNHLSSPFLKQCFAYISIFPKGYKFDKEKLILLWMAQGFLLHRKGGRKSMEQVGKDYFQKLLANSFFHQAREDDKSLFKMHDLIHEFAQFSSIIQSCLVEKGKSTNFSDKTRHVSYACDEHERPAVLIDVLRKAKFLWTFLQLSLLSNSIGSSSIGTEVVNELRKQKRLRVLSLSYQKDELPGEFGKQRHLRYLDLSNSGIVNLPETISGLYTLQTLILSHCTRLIKLPKKMAALIYLGHLDLTGTRALQMMPPEFGKLKRLRMLTNFVVSNSAEASSIEELGKLLHLCGKLSIVELQNVRHGEDAENAKLKEKNVKELEFKWSSNGQHDQEEVLEKLHPHEDIEKLSIAGYDGKRLPNWLGDSSFSKMVILRLSECRNCSYLPSLGQLSSLQQLHVMNMPNCEHWLSSPLTGGGYPSLQELYVQKCGKLIEIPNFLPKLKLLFISECSKLQIDKFEDYPVLQTLHIRSCDCPPVLKLNFSSNLKFLQMHYCSCLEDMVFSESLLQEFNCFQELEITDCPSLESFSGIGLSAPSLTTFSVSNCIKLRSMPKQMHTLLNSLQTLNISGCPALVSFPDGGLPQSLQTLTIQNCVNLTPQNTWGLRNMTSLTCLTIDCAYTNVTSFPEVGLLPASLTFLHLSEFSELEKLNLSGLQHLTSLKHLQIHCSKLHELSDGKLPDSLSSLSITGSSSLMERCQNSNSSYWDKISHIPIKLINGNDMH